MNNHYDAAYFQWQDPCASIAAAEGVRWLQPFLKPTDAVLDFGCGGGHSLKLLSAHTKVGVEVNPVARQAAAAAGLATFPSLDDIPDKSQDLIYSVHALEHCDHPLKELTLLKGKLKDGGKVVFIVPAEPARRYRPDDVNQHLYTWNAMTLGNLFTRAGYLVESVGYLHHRLPPKTVLLYKLLPRWLFRLSCRVCGVLSKERQLMIVGAKSK